MTYHLTIDSTSCEVLLLMPYMSNTKIWWKYIKFFKILNTLF